MKKKRSRRSKRMKTSAMIVDVAGDLIDIGDNHERKQNNLNLACSAWNISLLPKSERNVAIERCVAIYREVNADVNVEDCDNIRENFDIVVQRKIAAFPSAKKEIIDAAVRIVGGKTIVDIVSVDHAEG